MLINIGVLPGYRWHYLARIWRTPLLGECFMATTTRAGFRLLLMHGNPRGLPRAFVDRMYRHFDRGTRRAVLRLYRATDDLGGDLARMLAAALSPLDRPALVLWGTHDPYLPVAFAERQRGSSRVPASPSFCASVGAVDEKSVREYIESQRWDDDVDRFKITTGGREP